MDDRLGGGILGQDDSELEYHEGYEDAERYEGDGGTEEDEKNGKNEGARDNEYDAENEDREEELSLEELSEDDARRRGTKAFQTDLQNAPRWVRENPELYREMFENDVPMNGREFLAQGYRLYRDRGGKAHVLYPTDEYREWLKNGGDPNNPESQQDQPHFNHHETLEERKERLESEQRLNAALAALSEREQMAEEQNAYSERNRETMAEQVVRLEDERQERRKLMENQLGDLSTTVEKGVHRGFREHMMEMVRDPEMIKQNAQKYYLLGQELWLKSKKGNLKCDQFDIIADAMVYDLSVTDKHNYTKFKNYPSVKRAAKERIMAALDRQGFSSKEQHQLKYQALTEFIEQKQKFARGGWATKGKVVDDKMFPYVLDGEDILWDQDFIDSDQEWQEIREKAMQKVADGCRLTSGWNDGLKCKWESDYKHYGTVFNFEVGPDLAISHNNEIQKEILDISIKGYDMVKDHCEFGLFLGKSWEETKELSADFRRHAAALETAKQFHTSMYDDFFDNAPEVEVRLVKSLLDTQKGSLDLFYKDEQTALRQGFSDALYYTSNLASRDRGRFFRPISWLKQNQEQLKLLAGEDYDEHDLVGSARAAARGHFYGLSHGIKELVKFYEHTETDMADLQQAERIALREYLDLVEPTEQNADKLANEFFTGNYGDAVRSVILNNMNGELGAEIEKSLEKISEKERQEKIAKAIQKIRQGASYVQWYYKGVEGRYDRIQFISPKKFVEQFKEATQDLPEQNAELRKRHLRQMSYGGFINILSINGLDPRGFPYVTKPPEKGAKEHANEYFKVFDYAEHLDELNDYVTEKIKNLTMSGESKASYRLEQRYGEWMENDEVREYFEAYQRKIEEQERETTDREAGRAKVRIFENTSIETVKDAITKALLDKDEFGDRFYGDSSNKEADKEEHDEVPRNRYVPAKVALERINALDLWTDFFKDYLPDADVTEAAMIFDPKYDTLSEAISHLDGNVYSVVAFNYAGKRCMIAECAGVNDSGGAASGAMKIWCGEINDRDGWKEIFRNHTKTQASAENLCKSINHYNLTADVMSREADNSTYIVDAEDDMFRLALQYFRTGDENWLRNNNANRQRIHNFIGPQQERSNPRP